MPSKCKKCGKPFQWRKTAKGKSMPVDPPLLYVSGDACLAWAEGNQEIRMATILDEQGVIRQGWVTKAGVGQHRGHEPHFATCPFAEEFRRPRP